MYKKIKLKRPMVIRKGDKVKECYFYKGTKTCLGPRCFWPKVGTCPHLAKANGGLRKAK